jgi:hypothetical protein
VEGLTLVEQTQKMLSESWMEKRGLIQFHRAALGLIQRRNDFKTTVRFFVFMRGEVEVGLALIGDEEFLIELVEVASIEGELLEGGAQKLLRFTGRSVMTKFTTEELPLYESLGLVTTSVSYRRKARAGSLQGEGFVFQTQPEGGDAKAEFDEFVESLGTVPMATALRQGAIFAVMDYENEKEIRALVIPPGEGHLNKRWITTSYTGAVGKVLSDAAFKALVNNILVSIPEGDTLIIDSNQGPFSRAGALLSLGFVPEGYSMTCEVQ